MCVIDRFWLIEHSYTDTQDISLFYSVLKHRARLSRVVLCYIALSDVVLSYYTEVVSCQGYVRNLRMNFKELRALCAETKHYHDIPHHGKGVNKAFLLDELKRAGILDGSGHPIAIGREEGTQSGENPTKKNVAGPTGDVVSYNAAERVKLYPPNTKIRYKPFAKSKKTPKSKYAGKVWEKRRRLYDFGLGLVDHIPKMKHLSAYVRNSDTSWDAWFVLNKEYDALMESKDRVMTDLLEKMQYNHYIIFKSDLKRFNTLFPIITFICAAHNSFLRLSLLRCDIFEPFQLSALMSTPGSPCLPLSLSVLSGGESNNMIYPAMIKRPEYAEAIYATPASLKLNSIIRRFIKMVTEPTGTLGYISETLQVVYSKLHEYVRNRECYDALKVCSCANSDISWLSAYIDTTDKSATWFNTPLWLVFDIPFPSDDLYRIVCTGPDERYLAFTILYRKWEKLRDVMVNDVNVKRVVNKLVSALDNELMKDIPDFLHILCEDDLRKRNVHISAFRERKPLTEVEIQHIREEYNSYAPSCYRLLNLQHAWDHAQPLTDAAFWKRNCLCVHGRVSIISGEDISPHTARSLLHYLKLESIRYIPEYLSLLGKLSHKNILDLIHEHTHIGVLKVAILAGFDISNVLPNGEYLINSFLDNIIHDAKDDDTRKTHEEVSSVISWMKKSNQGLDIEEAIVQLVKLLYLYLGDVILRNATLWAIEQLDGVQHLHWEEGTPLLVGMAERPACRKHALVVARVLLKKGLNPNDTDVSGQTAASVAKKTRWRAMTALIKEFAEEGDDL